MYSDILTWGVLWVVLWGLVESVGEPCEQLDVGFRTGEWCVEKGPVFTDFFFINSAVFVRIYCLAIEVTLGESLSDCVQNDM